MSVLLHVVVVLVLVLSSVYQLRMIQSVSVLVLCHQRKRLVTRKFVLHMVGRLYHHSVTAQLNVVAVYPSNLSLVLVPMVRLMLIHSVRLDQSHLLKRRVTHKYVLHTHGNTMTSVHAIRLAVVVFLLVRYTVNPLQRLRLLRMRSVLA